MKNLFFFGPAAEATTLEQLGLALTFDRLPPADQPCEAALHSLDDWVGRLRPLLQPEDGQARPPNPAQVWTWRLPLFLEEVYRAGLRHWLEQTFSVVLPLRSAEELLQWRHLQARVIKESDGAFPIRFWSRNRQTLSDRDLLREGVQILGRASDLEADAAQGRLAWLNQARSDYPLYEGDEDYWARIREIEDAEGMLVPRGPSRSDYQVLARRAWHFLCVRLPSSPAALALRAPRTLKTQTLAWIF
jgi:hypothetical protein